MTDLHDRPPGGGSRPPGGTLWLTKMPRPPKARHQREGGVRAITPGVEALLRRTRLIGERVGIPRETFRAAGLPVLIAAVVAGGPGWTTYLVRDGDSLTAIARRHGTDVRALALVNGMTDADRVEVGRQLAVPVPPSSDDSVARRRAAAAGLHPVDTSGAPALSYRVRDGDTVQSIAERSGSSVRAVLAANGLRPNRLIRPGQLLVLPSLRTPIAAPPKLKRTARRPVVYVVRPADSVTAIAARFGVSAAAVARANRLTDPKGLSSSIIQPGQKLILPGATARPGRPVGTTSAHVVRRGETVTAIARRYGVGVAAVLAVNHLSSRTAIRPGRRLLVPVGSAVGSTPAVRRSARSRAAGGKSVGGETASSFLGRTYPDAVVRAAQANRAALSRGPQPDRAELRELIRRTARQHGVDPSLALAVASIESGFDQRQVSPANAIGVMQVLPSSGAWAGELLDRRLDLLDSADNVTAGIVLLATLLARQDEQTALAGYYQGLASVSKHGMFADTRRYVATVRTLKMRFR